MCTHDRQDIRLIGHDISLPLIGHHQLTGQKFLANNLAGPLFGDDGRSQRRQLFAALLIGVVLIPQTALETSAPA